MGGLLDLLTFPLMGPLKGMVWIAEKISEQAENELFSEDAIRGKLVELEMRFDLGEISEEDYMAGEDALLKMLRVAREYQAMKQRDE